jgi:hypothetical protein
VAGRTAKPRVWLHIGMPKTGTTAVQSVLYRNRGVLAQHGIYYPDFGDPQHISLVRELANKAGSNVRFPSNGDCGAHARFTDLLAADGGGATTSIVSSENFFQRPASLPGHSGAVDEGLAVLARTVDEAAKYFAGCDVSVVAWLRRQDLWLMSMYNETVKTSRYTDGFDVFARQTIGVHLLQIAKLWIAGFGRERVVLRSYDALAKARADMVESFLDTVCPQVPRAALDLAPERSNPSLGPEAMWLKLRINAQLQAKPAPAVARRIRKLLADVTDTSPDPRRSLQTAAERRALMGRFVDDNRELVIGLGYAELAPLAELDDLAAEPPAGPASKPCQHAVDRMIETLLLDDKHLKGAKAR